MRKSYKRARDLVQVSPHLFYNNATNKDLNYISNKFNERWAVEIETNFPSGDEGFRLRRELKLVLGVKEVEIMCSMELSVQFAAGWMGLLAAEEVSHILRKYGIKENPKSGNHYHVNLGYDVLARMEADNVRNRYPFGPWELPMQKKYGWMLKELECWRYKGAYNMKRISWNSKDGWVNFRPNYRTVEIRIGEMSIDHGTWIKRVMHIQSMAKRIRNMHNVPW